MWNNKTTVQEIHQYSWIATSPFIQTTLKQHCALMQQSIQMYHRPHVSTIVLLVFRIRTRTSDPWGEVHICQFLMKNLWHTYIIIEEKQIRVQKCIAKWILILKRNQLISALERFVNIMDDPLCTRKWAHLGHCKSDLNLTIFPFKNILEEIYSGIRLINKGKKSTCDLSSTKVSI